MKRKITLALCLLLMLALTAVPALAAGSVSVSAVADKISVVGGDTVTITVSAEVDTCQQGGIEISFDSAVLELTSGKCTLDNADIDYFDPTTKDGAFAFGNGSAVSGSIFEINLKVKDSAASGNYTVSITFTADEMAKTTTVSLVVACTHSYDNSCDPNCNLCGATRTVKHSYNEGEVTTAPTCTKEGVKTFTCTGCGATTTEAVAKTSHTYDEGKVTTAPTCTKDGVKTFTCSGCGATNTETVSKLGHSYKSQTTKEATCAEAGVKTVTCEVCGSSYTDTIAKKDHDYQSEVTQEATCQEAGVKTFTCKNCQASYTDTIEKLAHEYDDDCDASCNLCGQTRLVEHIYNQYLSADETGHWYECIYCGEVLELIPHTPGPAATEDEDQICLDCGFVLEAAGTHTHTGTGDWLSDENEHWRLCACGEIVDKEAHTWVLNQVDEETGVETYACLQCGLTEEATPPASAPETEPSTQPTETEPSGSESEPQQSKPSTQPTDPGQNDPGQEKEGFPWWIVWVVVGVLLAGGAIFVVVGILLSKKQVGKYCS